MDVVFWNSDHPQATSISRYIGPYKLSHWLKKHSFSSQVIDFIVYMTEEELYAYSKKFITSDTLALGISTTFMCNHIYTWPNGKQSPFPEHVQLVIRRLKQEFPNLKIVLGGYGSDRLYMSGLADATVMSYTQSNEDLFLEYLEYLKYKTPAPEYEIIKKFNAMDKIPVKHRVWFNKPKGARYTIDSDDFKWSKNDCILSGETLPLDVSRGCIFACRFCQYPHLGKGKFDYVRGMEYIREELIYNYENFNTVSYMILDDTFNDTEDKLQAFKDMTDTLPFKITYTAYLRADLIDRFPNTAYLLKDSGLFGAVHGIESLHPYASNLLGKGWSGKKAKEYIPKLYHDIWNGEVAQQLNFIIGLPKETKEDILNTVDWASSNNLYGMNLNVLGLFPKENDSMYTITSEFERNSEKYGLFFDEKGQWYNETWTWETANDFRFEIWDKLKENNLQKLNVWYLGNVMMLGYDKKYILNTPMKNFNQTVLMSLKHDKYREYFKKLSNL